jgi:predicted  nucleic acid-binding Zn-ribbon protein
MDNNPGTSRSSLQFPWAGGRRYEAMTDENESEELDKERALKTIQTLQEENKKLHKEIVDLKDKVRIWQRLSEKQSETADFFMKETYFSELREAATSNKEITLELVIHLYEEILERIKENARKVVLPESRK